MATLAETQKNSDGRKRGHVALFPSTGMGHLTPFLHLAGILAANHGFSVTFITTRANVCPSETAHIDGIASSGFDIRVVQLEIRSSLSETTRNESQDPIFAQWDALCRSMDALEHLLLTDLLSSSASRPPISAIITDPMLTTTLQVTAKFSIPNYILYTASALSLGFFLYAPILDSQGCDFSDEKLVLNIPAFPPLPTSQIAQGLKRKGSAFYKHFISNGSNALKASGILVNTFYDLEAPFLDALRSGQVMEGLPPVYPIGPLFLPSMSMMHSNSLKLLSSPDDDHDTAKRCLQWLDLQLARSVVFVSFGSRSAMSVSQITELASGLERSGQRFLWLLRISVMGDEGFDPSTVLPPGFESRVGGRGMVVTSWVPQVVILSHRAVGAFVSHCGWNSVVESVGCGVPIVAWPLFADQMKNARFVAENTKAGVEVKKGEDGIVRKEEVERAVRGMMEGEGDQLRKKAAELADLGRRAVREGGSSVRGMMEGEGDQLRKKAAELADLGRRAVREGGSSQNSLQEAFQTWQSCFIPT